MSATTVATEAPKKKRATKELPPAFSKLNEKNFKEFMEFRVEEEHDPSEPGETMVAYSVKIRNEDGVSDTQYELTKFTLEQLRRLARNLGVSYVNKCNKFQCRKALWILANHQEALERDGERLSTATERSSSNTIRLCNILFSGEFLEDLLCLNDIKNRKDHERGGMPSHFWEDIANILNCPAEDRDDENDPDVGIESIRIGVNDPHYAEVEDLDLNVFDRVDSNVVKKKFYQLMKVRKQIQKYMTVSGEHDSDPYNFVEAAMKRVGGCAQLTVIGVYYFHTLCDQNIQIDAPFVDTMDESLMGNTNAALPDDIDEDDEESPPTSTKSDKTSKSGNATAKDKKRVYDAMVEASETGKSIYEELRKTNRLVEQSQIIQLAQHLGKEDYLETLFSSLLPAPTNL
jgi:hypothetical protein